MGDFFQLIHRNFLAHMVLPLRIERIGHKFHIADEPLNRFQRLRVRTLVQTQFNPRQLDAERQSMHVHHRHLTAQKILCARIIHVIHHCVHRRVAPTRFTTSNINTALTQHRAAGGQLLMHFIGWPQAVLFVQLQNDRLTDATRQGV